MRSPQVGDIYSVTPGKQLILGLHAVTALVSPAEVTLLEKEIKELKTPVFKRTTILWKIDFNGRTASLREEVILANCKLVSYIKSDGSRTDFRCLL